MIAKRNELYSPSKISSPSARYRLGLAKRVENQASIINGISLNNLTKEGKEKVKKEKFLDTLKWKTGNEYPNIKNLLTLGNIIGEGKHAKVYEAIDRENSEQVAVKVFLKKDL